MADLAKLSESLTDEQKQKYHDAFLAAVQQSKEEIQKKLSELYPSPDLAPLALNSILNANKDEGQLDRIEDKLDRVLKFLEQK